VDVDHRDQDAERHEDGAAAEDALLAGDHEDAARCEEDEADRVGIGVKDHHGNWVLMKWDYKTKILSYTFDDSVTSGKHTFELTVTDQVNNVSTFKADFYR